MRLDVDAFRGYASRMTIASKEFGLVKMDLWPVQLYGLREIARGLEDGIHDFVTLKVRQIGESSKNDAFRTWWPQINDGTTGLFVSNSDENRDLRRDISLEMMGSLPIEYRHEVRVNNRNMLAWQPNPATGFGGSRLLFSAAGARAESDLGRSRGINFLDADELGLFPSEHDIESLRSALSKRYERRLYLWNGTAKGDNIFKTMCDTARHAATQRFLFISWWRHHLYRVEQAERAIWEKYDGRVTADERMWMRAVKKEYDVEIEPEQVIFYRWILDEDFYGDETMRAQEMPCLPEDAFVAFGDHLVADSVIRKLRQDAKAAPRPTGFTWLPKKHLDETRAEPCAPQKAALLVWEQAENGAAYIVAGHPWGSSSPTAKHWVAQVFRAWPDHLTQVAEYTSEHGTAYGFAWLLSYLGGGYRRRPFLPYIVLEVDGPGYTVESELQVMERYGYGYSPAARDAGLYDVVAAVNHYWWRRPDNYGGKAISTIDVKSTSYRLFLLHDLADTVVRGDMDVRSPALIDSIEGVRRGESGDADEIGGGGGKSDAHAMCAALAVRCWKDTAMGDLQVTIPKKEAPPEKVTHMGEYLVGAQLGTLLRTGRMK